MDRLYGDYEYTFEDVDRTKGMDFVQKYLRMKHVIVFKMSHDVLQVTSTPSSLSRALIPRSPHAVQLLRPLESDLVIARSASDAYRQELQVDAVYAERGDGASCSGPRARHGCGAGQVSAAIGRQAQVLQGGVDEHKECERGDGGRLGGEWQGVQGVTAIGRVVRSTHFSFFHDVVFAIVIPDMYGAADLGV